MLSGTFPFVDLNQTRLYKKILHCDYNFDGNSWNKISQEAKNVITGMLHAYPQKRYSKKKKKK